MVHGQFVYPMLTLVSPVPAPSDLNVESLFIHLIVLLTFVKLTFLTTHIFFLSLGSFVSYTKHIFLVLRSFAHCPFVQDRSFGH